jgi:oligopeptide transport system permease protein
VLAGVLQYWMGVYFKILPVARYETIWHTILPSFALSLGTMAVIARYMRASMLEIMSADYIKTARAKGLRKGQIVWRHQLRNALFPILTILGPAVASVLTGSFVIETIFAIPGLGRHFVMAMQNFDYTLVLGLTIFFGFFLIAMNFLVDVAYGIIDPRIRHA